MKWIKIDNKNRPNFDENVLITCTELNKEEDSFLTTVASLECIKEDGNGFRYVWFDNYNSGIIEPTHFCAIPLLDSEK